MKDQGIDKPVAGKLEGESGADPPKVACTDEDLFYLATRDYIHSYKIRRNTLILMEIVAFFLNILVLAWWVNPDLFGVMTASLEKIRFINNIVVACILLSMFFIIPLVWLVVFKRWEKAVHEAALRWIEDGRIMEFQRCTIRELLASISPELRRSIIDRQGGDSETKEINLLLFLVDAGNSSLANEPILEENIKRVQGFLSSIPQLTSLFQAHLDTTVGVTEKAAFEIMRQLGEVKTVAEDLVSKLGSSHTKAQVMGHVAQATIEESRELVEKMNAHQIVRDRQIRDDAAGIESVVQEIEELKSLTVLIHDVTSQTNVVAINAAIEAARAGKAGRGFTIVASEVRKLSRQIDDATLRIEDSIKKVSDTARKRLSAIVAQTRLEAEERWLSTLASVLPRVSGSFVDTVTEFNDLSLRTQDSVQLIRSSVMEVLGQAQFQDIARQQIEQVQKGLALFSQKTEALSGILGKGLTEPLDIAPLVELLKTMDNNYTMLPQRKTHNATIGGKPTDDEESLPRIQLF